MKRVFLDANIYFAGSLSKEGASAFVLELARRKKIEVVSSKLVLCEADRNLLKKAPPQALRAFRKFLRETRLRIVNPSEKALRIYEGAVEPKDIPVLAAAADGEADFLLTLDRKHFLSSACALKLKKPRIMSPCDFLRDILAKGKI